MGDQLKDFIKKNRTEFEFRFPTPELRTSVLTVLSEKKKQKRRRAVRTRLSIAAILTVILGFFTLMVLRTPGTGTTEQIAGIKPVNDRKEGVTNADLAPTTITPDIDLEKQVIAEGPKGHPARKVVSASEKEHTDNELSFMLSEDRPPSYRINGLQKISELEHIGEDLLEQVTETAVDDGNTNVRLAAVGVLVSKYGNHGLQEHLITAFLRQDDPIVQSELIDIITTIDSVSRDPKVRKKLKEIGNDPLSEGFVRERALVLLMEEGH